MLILARTGICNESSEAIIPILIPILILVYLHSYTYAYTYIIKGICNESSEVITATWELVVGFVLVVLGQTFVLTSYIAMHTVCLFQFLYQYLPLHRSLR